MPTPTSKINFLVCPACRGTGRGEKSQMCPKCDGYGTGAWAGGKFYYWGQELSVYRIEFNRLKRTFDIAVNMAAFLAGIAGVIALGWWIFKATRAGDPFVIFNAWKERDTLLLVFWASLVPDMFVTYRLAEEKEARTRIAPLPHHQDPDELSAASWDAVKRSKRRNRIDVSRSYSEEAMKVAEEAYLAANSSGFRLVLPKHIFLKLLDNNRAAAAMSRLSVYIPDLAKVVNKQLSFASLPADALYQGLNTEGIDKDGPKESSRTALSAESRAVLIGAFFSARSLEQDYVESTNFYMPLVEIDEEVGEILYDFEVEPQKLENVVKWFRVNDQIIENYRHFRSMARFKPGSDMDRAYTAIATPILNHFGYDLTAAAKWGRLDFCVAREKEIDNIFGLMESGYCGIIIVGPEGVGRNTIIHGIAQLMVKEDVPEILKDKRLVELDVARLVSGAAAMGAEGRLMSVIDEAARSRNVVLAINNIENIIGISAGGAQSLDLSEVLSEALSRRSVICFATATPQNFTRYIENQALGNVMGKVVVEEPDSSQAVQIVSSKIGFMEGKYRAYYSYKAIEDAIDITKRYMHDSYLPDKAIKVLEIAGVKSSKSGGKKFKMISRKEIASVVTEMTHIPVSIASEEESEKLLTLESRIHEHMISQEEAVDMVAASLRRARAQMREGKRPIASFLFLGPTGVGKTELAKTVAQEYFGDAKAMIRIDMSEYQTADTLNKMIGDASGAVGYLTEAVRKAPFSLLLLDEIEKAYSEILNLFLQVMDDGRLTDGQGRTIDFTNTIIIATSNVGAVYIQDEIKKNTPTEDIKEELINSHLNKYLRPELINRFDGVIVFKPLTEKDVFEITKLMLKGIAGLLEPKGILFRAEDKGVEALAKAGFDPKFGARPLRRVLQDKVENSIANLILANRLERRDTVVVDDDMSVKVEKGRRLR